MFAVPFAKPIQKLKIVNLHLHVLIFSSDTVLYIHTSITVRLNYIGIKFKI